VPKSPALAFRWALETFRRNLLAFLLLSAVVVALRFGQPYVIEPIASGWLACTVEPTPELASACLSAAFGSFIATAVLALAFIVVTLIASIGVYRAALRSTLGQPPSFADLLSGEYFGTYVRVIVLQMIMVFIGLVLFIIPGLIVLFFVQLAHLYVLDRGYGAIEAIRASFITIGRNIGVAIIMSLITIALFLPGFLFVPLIFLGLPIYALFVAHMYRQLNDQPI
jgi:uncharacterized membrane protein